jgi:nucleoid DNA-binding protein
MYKSDVIKEVSKTTGVDPATVKLVFNAITENILGNLLMGYNVKIKEFMNLTLEVQKEVRRRNPRTGKFFVNNKHYKVKVALPRSFKDKLKKKIVY